MTSYELNAYLLTEEYAQRRADLARRSETEALTEEQCAKILGLTVHEFRVVLQAHEMTQELVQLKFEEVLKQKFETWKQRPERTTVERENLSTEQRATIEGLAHKLLLIEPQDRAPAMLLFVGEYHKSLCAKFPELSQAKIESAIDHFGDLIFNRFCELDATVGGHA